MKELLLITFANKFYLEKLESKGFPIIEYGQPLSDQSINEINNIGFSGIAVIEFIEDSMQRLENTINVLRKNSVRVVALAARINNNLREYFFKLGISEVLESNNADRVANYLDITEKNSNKMYGKLLILEDNNERINILKTIIDRFNYSPVIAESIDQFFDSLNGVNIQLILINMGLKDFDLNYFLRRSFSSEMYKRIPVIPYKDKSEGLFIHEMISGLNKITKVILNTDEIYSFLVDILFRKELSPGINLLTETLDVESMNKFAIEPLNRLYMLMGTDIFSMKRIITKENIDIINGRIDSLRNLTVKVDGFKWLINEAMDASASIAGFKA
ncbi:MAG: hypothetical protein V1874_13005 [Spirochaetota bacterium]